MERRDRGVAAALCGLHRKQHETTNSNSSSASFRAIRKNFCFYDVIFVILHDLNQTGLSFPLNSDGSCNNVDPHV